MVIPHRIKRVEKQLLRVLSEILTFEIKNEKLKSVIFSDAKVSKDLSLAKIYYFINEKKGIDENVIANELNKLANIFKKYLYKKLIIKKIPQLKFLKDTSLEYSYKIDKLLDAEKKYQEKRNEAQSKTDN